LTATEIDISASPATTHAVLVDASTYPEWLVGAKRIRAVDPDWPAIGTSFHHAVGAGPLTIKDRTTVLEHPDEQCLVLEAHIGPLGAARVRFSVAPLDGGDATHLTVDEEPSSGLARLLWNTPARPLVAASLWGRNAVSLQSLRSLVEDRAATGATDTTATSEQTPPA